MRVGERTDLQRLLRTQIDVLGDELYVLTEEFGDWEDSKRRIDLFAIDKQANLVVIELKRTQDGGHMELQAIRYASMVSAMTFERAEQIHAEFLTRLGEEAGESKARLLEFLGWDEPDEENFAEDVRIILVSEDFGKELTTAVLWLRDHDIDIRCVRLRPYRNDAAKLKAFGEELSWERLDKRRACRIKSVIRLGSFQSPESEWPAIQVAMVDAMAKLESALRPALDSLRL